MKPYRNSYKKGDKVETPLGVGEIITEISFTGVCFVRLDSPLKGGDSDGQQEIMSNTFQMRHV